MSNEFEGISLYHEVPEAFLAGESYIFRGRVLKTPNPDRSILVTIVFRNSDNGQRFMCTEYLPKGSV